MSIIYDYPLPDVDDEGPTVPPQSSDGPNGLKVDGGSQFLRQNSESKSSSVEVIPDSSVESFGMLTHDKTEIIKHKELKNTDALHLGKHREIPQLLQSTQDVEILTPPTDDKKVSTTFNLHEMQDEKQSEILETEELLWDDWFDSEQNLIKLDREEKLDLDRTVLTKMADFTEPVVPFTYIGRPCFSRCRRQKDEDENNVKAGISLQYCNHPEHSSRIALCLDQPHEGFKAIVPGSVTLSACIALVSLPCVFWIDEGENQYEREVKRVIETREKLYQNVLEFSTLPDIHVVYQQLRHNKKKPFHNWDSGFLSKLKDKTYCHLHVVELDEKPDWETITALQQRHLAIKTLRAKEHELLTMCKPLTIGGASINGKRFSRLLEICVDEINNSGSNVIERFLTYVEEEISVVTEKLTEKFSTLLKQNTETVLPIHEDILEREHGKLCEDIMVEFSREVLLTDKLNDKARQGLQDNMQAKYQQVLDHNRQLSAEKCQLLVENCFRDIQTKLAAAIYDIDSPDYQRDLEQTIAKYKNTPGKGPLADKVLISFMKKLGRQRGKQVPGNNTVSQGIPDDDFISWTDDQKSDLSQLNMSESHRGFSRKAQDKKIGDISVKVYDQVFQLEQRNDELEQRNVKLQSTVDRLHAEINTLSNMQLSTNRPFIRDSAEVGVNTDEAAILVASPVTSLSPQDTQWIHVEKQQSQKETVCVCKEITEREVKLQSQNRKLKDKLQELTEANSSWEKHCQTIQDGFSKQVTGLLDELQQAKKNLRKMESEAEAYEERTAEIESEAQKRVLEAEDQKTKAIGFASAQAEKVDELKRTVRKEKQHAQELEQRVRELQMQVSALKQMVEEMKSQAVDREVPQASPTMPEEMIHLSIENRPPPSREERRQNLYGPSVVDSVPVSLEERYQNSYGTSLWESIPPSLLVEPPPAANPCCRRLQQRLSQSETEIKVMQQQVTIYKDDFEKERRDRENAHSEIASMRSTCIQLTDDIKLLQDRVGKKSREADALKGARAQDQHKLQEKQDHIDRSERTIVELRAEIDRLKRQPHHIPQQPPPPYHEVPRPHTAPRDQRECSWEQQLMPAEWRRQLERHFVTFANHLKPYEVINQMYAQGLLSYQEKVRLDAIPIDYQKTEYIYHNVVMKLTRRELLTFKQILTDGNQVALARLLPSEDYTGPEWSCPRCTFRNPANLARCDACQKRAPNLEPLGGTGAVEQCDGDDAEWVQPATIARDTETEDEEDEMDPVIFLEVDSARKTMYSIE